MNDINVCLNNTITKYQKLISKEYPSITETKLKELWNNMSLSSLGNEKNLKKEKKPEKKKTAYQNFFVIARKEVTDKNPELKFGEISKLVSSQWNSMSLEEKKKYETKVEETKSSIENPYISLFENDEKEKQDLNRSSYEHYDDDDIDDEDEDDEDEEDDIDEYNFDEVV